MGKILEYGNLGAPPADNDLLFMGDYSLNPSNPTTKRLAISDLNKKRNVDAADGDGLKLRDDSGTYGIYIDDGGKVGIGTGINPGTVDPAYDLDLQTTGVTNFRIRSGDSHDSLIRFDQTSTSQAIMGYDHSAAVFKINNHSAFAAQNHLVINTDGNIGVGVVSPTVALDVAGDFEVVDGSYGIKIDASLGNIEGITSGGASGPLHLNRSGGEDIWFMYASSTDFAGKIESTNKRWSIGSKQPAGAKLHIYEDAGADNVALQLENRVASGSPNSILRFTRTVGSTSLEQQVVWDGTQLGIRNASAVALGSASVNFKAGSLDVGATGFTRKFNVTDSNNIVSEFNCSDNKGTRLLIRNTGNSTGAAQSSLIAFPDNVGGEDVNWMAGAYKDTSNVKYFCIQHSTTAPSASTDYVFPSTTTNNALRLDVNGNVRFKGTMEASAYYDQGGNTAGNYCRGKFTQTFSFPYYFETVNQRWSPLFAGPYDTTNNYHGSDAPTKQYASLAPMGGRITRIDVSLYMSTPSNVVKAYIFTGSSMPTGNKLTTSDSAYKTDIDVSSANSNSFTLGFDDFAASGSTGGQTNLDFSQGEFLMLAMDTNTGNGKCNVTVTVEFDVPDNLGA